MDEYMKIAVEEARSGIEKHEGGPFGAVIVLNGKIIGKGHNQVISHGDPTCHGEIQAIKNACTVIGSHDLTGCVIYTTGYPCPMCLGAIRWANIEKVFYGCNVEDTEKIGFRDKKFYCDPDGQELHIEEIGREDCLKLYDQYMADSENKNY